MYKWMLSVDPKKWLLNLSYRFERNLNNYLTWYMIIREVGICRDAWFLGFISKIMEKKNE